MKKSIKKGFTLVELIVVMAIFSILMVGVMSLITPVSNMFKSTAISEKTYSYANNVQQYLQTKLEYSENVFIGSSGPMGLTSDGKANNEKIAELVEDFRYSHYADTITTPDGGDTVNYLNGKIHVIRLVNSEDGKLSNGENVQKGQITHRVYDFNSKADAKISSDTVVDEVPELNTAFLNARDAAYDFSYSMGAGTLITHTPIDEHGDAITDERYKVLDNDLGNKDTGIDSSNLKFSIVLNKNSGGFIDCNGSNEAGAFTYRAFAAPCAIQVVNLPLTNFVHRCGRVGDYGKGLQRPKITTDPGDKDGIVEQTPDESGHGCDTYALDTKYDFSQDIYFIYTFTDEIN